MSELTLNIFVDGYGWELSQENRVFDDILPHSHRVESVLGYTNTALPTILTGRSPDEHDAFCLLVEAQGRSPFRQFPWLRLVPPILGRLPAVRRRVDRALLRRLGWGGYFTTGCIPYHRLHHYDYTEKLDIYAPGTFGVESVFDDLHRDRVPHWVFDYRQSEEANLRALTEELERGQVEWAFIGLQGYDGLVHGFGTRHDAPKAQLDSYRVAVTRLIELARRSYGTVKVNLFSDHGLADVEFEVDIRGRLAARGLRHGRDIFLMLDATMARLRCLRPGVSSAVREALKGARGAFVEGETRQQLGVDFSHDRYGDMLFVLEEGGLIRPNDLGHGAPVALHGYLPSAPSMDAVAMFSHAPARTPTRLTDLREVLLPRATAATDAPARQAQGASP